MDVMSRALRGVIIAGLVVATLILGAASIHTMTSGSPSMGAMSGATHVMESSDHVSGMHHPVAAAAADPTCDGMCGVGDALVTILCVAGVVARALLVLLLVPRSGSASRTLRVIQVHAQTAMRSRPRDTPQLTQLSISRT